MTISSIPLLANGYDFMEKVFASGLLLGGLVLVLVVIVLACFKATRRAALIMGIVVAVLGLIWLVFFLQLLTRL